MNIDPVVDEQRDAILRHQLHTRHDSVYHGSGVTKLTLSVISLVLLAISMNCVSMSPQAGPSIDELDRNIPCQYRYSSLELARPSLRPAGTTSHTRLSAVVGSPSGAAHFFKALIVVLPDISVTTTSSTWEVGKPTLPGGRNSLPVTK
jgi:hypothetical protein